MEELISVVDVSAIALALMSKDDATAKRIIKQSTDEYFRLLKSIAEDIYDSCIAVYYDSYEPRVYKRHGNLEGFNLYRANDMSFEDGYLSFGTEEDYLLKYGGSGDKRREVLDQVMSGFRGTTKRILTKKNWPMSWKQYCTYPNQFSKYKNHWQSTKDTMDDIFEEFSQEGLKDTNEYFWEIVSKYI